MTRSGETSRKRLVWRLEVKPAENDAYANDQWINPGMLFDFVVEQKVSWAGR